MIIVLDIDNKIYIINIFNQNLEKNIYLFYKIKIRILNFNKIFIIILIKFFNLIIYSQ